MVADEQNTLVLVGLSREVENSFSHTLPVWCECSAEVGLVGALVLAHTHHGANIFLSRWVGVHTRTGAHQTRPGGNSMFWWAGVQGPGTNMVGWCTRSWCEYVLVQQVGRWQLWSTPATQASAQMTLHQSYGSSSTPSTSCWPTSTSSSPTSTSSSLYVALTMFCD